MLISADPALTPSELREARLALGLSFRGLARILGVASERTAQRWEYGERDIPGPVSVLMRLLMDCAEARQKMGLPEHLRGHQDSD